MKSNIIKCLLIPVAVFFIVNGCNKKESKTKPPSETEITTQEVESQKQIENYLGEGVVLAAHEVQDDWYCAVFHPAKIIKQASPETNNEYQVEAVVGSGGVAKGYQYSSKYLVFKSHPPSKEELKPDVVVLWPGAGYGDLSEPKNEAQLNKACWNRARIVKTDHLDKGLVEIEYEKPGLTGPVHIKNIRICDDPEMILP